MSEAIDHAEPTLDDERTRPGVHDAVLKHRFFQVSPDELIWWMVAEAPGVIAVGIGNKKKTRMQAAKLALAIAASVARPEVLQSADNDQYRQVAEEAIRLRGDQWSPPTQNLQLKAAVQLAHREWMPPSVSRGRHVRGPLDAQALRRIDSTIGPHRSGNVGGIPAVVSAGASVRYRFPPLPPPVFELKESFEFCETFPTTDSYAELFVDLEVPLRCDRVSGIGVGESSSASSGFPPIHRLLDGYLGLYGNMEVENSYAKLFVGLEGHDANPCGVEGQATQTSLLKQLSNQDSAQGDGDQSWGPWCGGGA